MGIASVQGHPLCEVDSTGGRAARGAQGGGDCRRVDERGGGRLEGVGAPDPLGDGQPPVHLRRLPPAVGSARRMVGGAEGEGGGVTREPGTRAVEGTW